MYLTICIRVYVNILRRPSNTAALTTVKFLTLLMHLFFYWLIFLLQPVEPYGKNFEIEVWQNDYGQYPDSFPQVSWLQFMLLWFYLFIFFEIIVTSCRIWWPSHQTGSKLIYWLIFGQLTLNLRAFSHDLDNMTWGFHGNYALLSCLAPLL